jgi:hypothetical protein
MSRQLPKQFDELAPFIEEWALSNERDRYVTMLRHTPKEIMPFYKAMMQRMDEIIEYLNGFDLERMPQEAQTVFDLTLSLIETGHCIDLGWPATESRDAVEGSRLEFFGPSLGR